MKNIFTQHPRTVGETYFQHLKFAFFTGLIMVLAGIACIIHSLLPFIFKETASKTIEWLYQRASARKNQSAYEK